MTIVITWATVWAVAKYVLAALGGAAAVLLLFKWAEYDTFRGYWGP